MNQTGIHAPVSHCAFISSSTLSKLSFGALFLFALLLRIFNLFVIEVPIEHAFIEDSIIYWNGAESWLYTGFFSRPTNLGPYVETERMPGYFLFLMAFRYVFADAFWLILIAQALFDAGTCIMIAHLGATFDRNVGIIAGLLAAAWPNFIVHSTLILTDSLFVFILCLSFVWLFRHFRTGQLYAAVLVGLFAGLACLVRAVGLPVLFLLGATIFVFWVWNQKNLGKGVIAGLIVVVMGVAPLLPISIRNLVQFDTLQLTSQSGTHMLSWVVAYSKALDTNQSFAEVSEEFNGRLEQTIRDRNIEFVALNAFEWSDLKLERARIEIASLPSFTLVRGWLRGAALNIGVPAIISDPRIRSMNTASFLEAKGSGLFQKARTFLENNDRTFVTLLVIGIVFSGLSSLLQLAGWIVLVRRDIGLAVFMALIVAYFLLINGPVGGAKYRLPLEPFLIILQAVVLSYTIRLIVGLKQRLGRNTDDSHSRQSG